MVAMPPYAGSHDGMPADQREQLLLLPRFTRRVNVNTEDEATIGQLLHLTFIEARRICMERPFQDAGELLKVRGMSRITMQQWEAGLRSFRFFSSVLSHPCTLKLACKDCALHRFNINSGSF